MEVISLSEIEETALVEEVVEVLKEGGLIVFPTETCYGLGVDATNEEAVTKLLIFKRKREGKAISVVMADQEMAEEYVELNKTAKGLYRNFLPGPMTVISRIKKQETRDVREPDQGNTVDPAISIKSNIDSRVVSEFGTLGVRVPDHRLAIKIVKKLGRPMTATSANVSYKPNPYSLKQWKAQTPKKSQELVDLFIDAGELEQRPSSTVVDTTKDELTVVRQGTIVIDSPTLVRETRSEEETRKMAKELIGNLKSEIEKRGLVIGLQGELGAGKTRFAQGVAVALEIEEQVKSPTFTLVEEYPLNSQITNNKLQTEDTGSLQSAIRNYFYHIDTWRMETEDEMLGIGFEEMLKPGNVVVIEWVEKVVELAKEKSKEYRVKMLLGTVEEGAKGKRVWRFEEIR